MSTKEDSVQVVKMGAWSPGPGCREAGKTYIKNGKLLKIEGMKTILISRTAVPQALASLNISIIPTA
jgi:hypothetical protein